MGDDNYCYRNTTQKGAMYGAGHNVEEVEIIDLDRPPKQYAVPLITSLPEPKRVATAATQPASPAPSKPRPVATVAVVAAPQPAPSPAADPKPAATVIPEANLGLKDLAALADAICAGGEFPEWWPLFTPYISAIARQCEKTNRLVAERVRLHNEIKALEDALKPIQGIPSLHNAAEALRTKLASLNERLAKLKRKLDEPSSRVEREKTRRIQAEVKEFAARIKEILMLGEPKN
ncbi:MAG: hypothetical protein BWY68_00479 [bacterium ADurb.Bin400]|nr:MAG: hypothetical protein BWY68_00479 [bacterium ADurb.Bin400]